MNNVILSTRNIDEFISDVANEVVKRIELWKLLIPPQEEAQERLITVQETAEFLNLTIPTIYTKVSKGELPVMKRGKRLYFSSKELVEYLKEGRKKSNSEIDAEAESYLNKKGGSHE